MRGDCNYLDKKDDIGNFITGCEIGTWEMNCLMFGDFLTYLDAGIPLSVVSL